MNLLKVGSGGKEIHQAVRLGRFLDELIGRIDVLHHRFDRIGGDDDAGHGRAEADIVVPFQGQFIGDELVGEKEGGGDGEPDHRARPQPAQQKQQAHSGDAAQEIAAVSGERVGAQHDVAAELRHRHHDENIEDEGDDQKKIGRYIQCRRGPFRQHVVQVEDGSFLLHRHEEEDSPRLA